MALKLRVLLNSPRPAAEDWRLQGKRDDSTHWATAELEKAAEDYRMACADAESAVKQVLSDLCDSLMVSHCAKGTSCSLCHATLESPC